MKTLTTILVLCLLAVACTATETPISSTEPTSPIVKEEPETTAPEAQQEAFDPVQVVQDYREHEQNGDYEGACEYTTTPDACLSGYRMGGHLETTLYECDAIVQKGEYAKVECRQEDEIYGEYLTNYTLINGRISQTSD